MNEKQKQFGARYSLKSKLHAISYGADLKLTLEEANLLVDKYKITYPAMDELLKQIHTIPTK